MVSLNAHFWNVSEKDKDCDSFWTTRLALTGLCFSDLSMGRVPKSLMGFRRKSSTPCSSVTQIPLLSSSFLLFASRAQHSSFEPLYPGWWCRWGTCRETFHIWIIMKWTGKKAAPAGRNLQTWFVNQSTNGSSMLARSFKHKNSRLLFHLCIFLLHFGLNRNAFDSLNDSFTAKLDMNILSRSTNFRYEEQSSG